MRIILSCIAVLLFITSHAKVDSIASFKITSYSFGKIKQNVPAVTEFSFVNKGDKPLIIEVATAECGCTTPDYPETPIQKGKTGVIKVTYNAESPGKFSKRVTVKFANIATPVVLTIDGEVIEKS
jgi:uncharacterized protein DUF1573